MAALFPVTAWKPDLMLATEQRDPHVSHCKKKRRVSFCRMVSGERHVWHVIYSLMYRLRTFSICFCWNLPLIMSWLFPSTEPLVPNSASRKSNKCLGCRCNVLHISVKLAKDVFFVPIRTTWGGRITNFCFFPATMSGFLSRMMSNTRVSNSSYV